MLSGTKTPRTIFGNNPSRRAKSRRAFAARRGVAIVEAAFVLPVFMLLIFGLLFFGHYYFINSTIEMACREAARYGSTAGVTSSDIQQRLTSLLDPVLDTDHVTITVLDASVLDQAVPEGETMSDVAANLDFSELSDVEAIDMQPTQLFVVTATVDYNDVAVMPLSIIFGSGADSYSPLNICKSAFMRHE